MSFIPASPVKITPHCRYYATSGYCYYGDKCAFVHVSADPDSPLTSPMMSSSMARPRSRKTCRNIAVHGYCRYMNKGCEYNHDMTPDMERGLISSPISHPMSGPSSENSLASTSTCARNLDLAMTPPPPQPFTSYEGGTVYFTAPSVPATPDTNAALLSSPIKRTLPNACQSGISHSPAHQIESIGGTTYFYNNSPYHSPNISHYPSGVCSTTGGAWPHQETPSDLFMSENVRLELLHRNACLLARLDSNDTHGHPLSLGKYHDLYPLDGTSSDHMNDRLPLGYRSTCYKAIRESDGTPCCLRVLKGVKTSYDAIQMAIQSWKRIQHANVASLYDAFISNDFDEPALVCVSSYHPGAETLSSRYIKHHTANENGTAAANPIIFPEDLLWTFAVQLSSAVRSIQAAGLACGTLDPSKIIVTANNRIRLSAVGVLDILNFGSDCPHSITYYQAEDLTLMGHLLLSLACGKWPDDSMEQCTKHMETVEARYSSDFKNLLGYLLSPSEPHQPKTINDLMPMIGPRFYKEMEGAYSKMDRLYDDLSKEETNGKLLRLLCKMGFVVDRPEFDIDPTWSETGDRYLVKLLRDYTFHQVTEDNEPVISVDFVSQCLNKLDVGIGEKIGLMSRDEQSVLVVSYKDLKKCVNGAYKELVSASTKK